MHSPKAIPKPHGIVISATPLAPAAEGYKYATHFYFLFALHFHSRTINPVSTHIKPICGFLGYKREISLFVRVVDNLIFPLLCFGLCIKCVTLLWWRAPRRTLPFVARGDFSESIYLEMRQKRFDIFGPPLSFLSKSEYKCIQRRGLVWLSETNCWKHTKNRWCFGATAPAKPKTVTMFLQSKKFEINNFGLRGLY